MNNESTTVVGNEGTVEVPPEPRRPNKIDEKRQKIYRERMQRHIAKGLSAEQAHRKVMEEDYARLPIDQKMRLLEQSVMGAVQRLAQELESLQHNDRVIADALDVNFKAITKALLKQGVPGDDLAAFLKEAEEEIRTDREARRAAYEAAQQAAIQAQQQKQVEQTIDKPGEAPVPDGATTFEG